MTGRTGVGFPDMVIESDLLAASPPTLRDRAVPCGQKRTVSSRKQANRCTNQLSAYTYSLRGRKRREAGEDYIKCSFVTCTRAVIAQSV
jgi:hypothetical protein